MFEQIENSALIKSNSKQHKISFSDWAANYFNGHEEQKTKPENNNALFQKRWVKGVDGEWITEDTNKSNLWWQFWK